MAPTVCLSTNPLGGDEPADRSVRCAPGDVAMLSKKTTAKTPAPIAAIDAPGQFLKIINMMLSTRLTERLGFTPRLVAGVEHDVRVFL